MCYADTREKILELERLVVAGERGNCLNKISGGGGIKKLYTDKSCEEFSEPVLVAADDAPERPKSPLENALMYISGQYDLSGIKRLISMDVNIQKLPTDKELKKFLDEWVRAGIIQKKGKIYDF